MDKIFDFILIITVKHDIIILIHVNLPSISSSALSKSIIFIATGFLVFFSYP